MLIGILCGKLFVYNIPSVDRESPYDPDFFTGTDSEKLQQCFDALANSGGSISIRRTYNLSEDLIINNDSDQQRFIHVYGFGKDAKINCGSHRITAPKERHVWGGVLWNDISFEGTSIGFDAGLLIRMWFSQCSFKGFTRVFSADSSEKQTGETNRYIQTLYLEQCTIKGVGTGIYISGNGAYNMGLHQCLIENASYGIRNVEGSLMGVRIQDCVIEAIWNTGIYVGGNASSLTIDNNYFEANPQCVFFEAKAGHRAISIHNNYFVASGNSAIVITPNSTAQANQLTGVIDGNTYNDTTHTKDFICFTSVPKVRQTWKIEDNYPNTVANAGTFVVGSNMILPDEVALDTAYIDGCYAVDGLEEIVQVITAGDYRVQVQYKNDIDDGLSTKFRIQNIHDNNWSNWS